MAAAAAVKQDEYDQVAATITKTPTERLRIAKQLRLLYSNITLADENLVHYTFKPAVLQWLFAQLQSRGEVKAPFLVDLKCSIGVTCIAASIMYGWKCEGFDLDAKLITRANTLASVAGVTDLCTFRVVQDGYKSFTTEKSDPFSSATYVCFLEKYIPRKYDHDAIRLAIHRSPKVRAVICTAAAHIWTETPDKDGASIKAGALVHPNGSGAAGVLNVIHLPDWKGLGGGGSEDTAMVDASSSSSTSALPSSRTALKQPRSSSSSSSSSPSQALAVTTKPQMPDYDVFLAEVCAPI